MAIWLTEGSTHTNMRHTTGNKLETSLYKYSKIIAILLDLIKIKKTRTSAKIEN